MDYSPAFSISCKIIGGIFWTLTYILIIRKGFMDKSYGIPFIALAFNFSWETIFSFIYPPESPQSYINIVWFVFDCIIVIQFLKYGKNNNEYNLSEKWFYHVVTTVFVLAFLHTLTMALEFRDFIGKYSAFTMNLTMSILFVVLYFRRRSLIGQSIFIAIFKMVGTLCFSLLFFVKSPGAAFMNFLYIVTLGFDGYYIILVARHGRTAEMVSDNS